MVRGRHMARSKFMVMACYDDEAEVWYVEESDVPGLTAEADTVEQLLEKLKARVPELLALNEHLLNNGVESGGVAPIELVAHRQAALQIG